MLVQPSNRNKRPQDQPQLLYPTDALRRDLIRIRETWRESRRQHDRFSVYEYLGAVFDLVMVLEKEGHAVDRAKRALRVMGREGGDKIEPFAAVIKCTSSQKKVDPKLRSKWVRALMFAARKKTPSESLGQFIRHLGGINACASQS
jgi:hypothetical protein